MKHILITGGSDGIGKAVAQKLKAADHNVTILSRDESKTRTVAEEIGCHYVVADLADSEQLNSAIDRAAAQHPIDILINNAGVWIQGPLEENDVDQIKRTFETNTLGTVLATKAVVPAMKKAGKGRIINVISQAGLTAKAERAVYNASKWAITGFTKSMQLELRAHKISVVGFYPGAVNTAMFDKVGNSRDMSRALDPDTVAETMAYICGLPDHVNIPEFGIDNLNY